MSPPLRLPVEHSQTANNMKSDIADKPYRLNVGIVLFNKDGHVFVGERTDTPGAWQMPQGGIDEGEDYLHAAYRELLEETGIPANQVEVIKIMDDFLYYDFPANLKGREVYENFKGQQQKWVAMRYLGQDDDINLEGHEEVEFSRWQWVPLEETVNLIVRFKKKVYADLITLFSDIS